MVVLEREPIPALPPMRAPITVREAVEADWPAFGRICHDAFATLAIHHGFPPDFPTVEATAQPIRRLIDHPDIYGVTAERDGRVLGSSFLDERALASAIGPVSVNRRAQDEGIGRALMAAMLERVETRRTPGVRLVQIAYHNRSLRWSLAHGLRILFVTNLMARGIYQPPRGPRMPPVGS